jgi:hypothetical protein
MTNQSLRTDLLAHLAKRPEQPTTQSHQIAPLAGRTDGSEGPMGAAGVAATCKASDGGTGNVEG